MKLLLTSVLIWFAFAVPVALAVGRMLAGTTDNDPPAPPTVRQPARNHLVRT